MISINDMLSYLPMDSSRNMMEDKINEILEHLNKPPRIEIQWKRLTSTAKLPLKAYADDAGRDIFSDETVIIPPYTTVKVKTGLACANTPGYFLKAFDKSSMAEKSILTLAGVIDNYRGEILVVLHNLSDKPYQVNQGDKITQMILLPCYSVSDIEVDELPPSERGEKGFGSSGK